MKLLKYIGVCWFFLGFTLHAQEDTVGYIHDQACSNVSDVLFDSKAKPIRDRLKTFENDCGIKLQFRVEDQSLEQIGGLSQHLFKLFQNFTTTQNTNAKTITGEFSTLANKQLSDKLSYQTKATEDLRKCVLPTKDSQHLDSIYTKFLKGQNLTNAEIEESPEQLNGFYDNAGDGYEKILKNHWNCEDFNKPDAYNVHVVNTRQNRHTNWITDASALSLNISTDYGLLSSNGTTYSPTNNGSTSIDLQLPDNVFNGTYVLNLNNAVNSCTQRDMNMRCALLYKKTGIRFIFVCQSLNYFLPLDSLNKFRDAATATFSTNTTDDIIVALYLKMSDTYSPATTGALLVKQINGSWLTNADINFAAYNQGGDYNLSTFPKFKNLYKNIPKPLLLCYQVAKVNGLLTTSYFSKSAKVKGREQIYTHVFKLDAAFDELKQLEDQQAALTNGINNAPNFEIALARTAERDEVYNKIKIAYLKAQKIPQLKDAPVYFKDFYLQKPNLAQAGALRYLRDTYGFLYKDNQFKAYLDTAGLPEDLLVGTCKTYDRSDVIADALNVSSLILMAVELDFISDALLVAYYASQNESVEAVKASLNFFVPGNVSGLKKAITGSANAIKEINAGSKLLIEANQLKAVQADVNHITAAFGLKPELVDASLVNKINNNPAITTALLPLTENQAQIYSAAEKLNDTKKIEFVKKTYDDPDFRQKVLVNSEEALRWGGVIDDFATLLAKQKKRLEDLKKLYGDLDFDNFTPVGGKTTSDITSALYNEMFLDLGSRTNWSIQEKTNKIVEILGSGSTVPQKITYQQGTELYKLVKKGRTPNPTTEYWFTKTELDILIAKGSHFESKSGIPLGSFADEYDIYKITANQPAKTYRSTIAPTYQKGYTNVGGVNQTLVLDRTSWSMPIKYNTESYIPNY